MNLSDKTIAVTGATGFLGTYICLELLKRGASVRGVVRTPSKGKWLETQGVTLAQAQQPLRLRFLLKNSKLYAYRLKQQ